MVSDDRGQLVLVGAVVLAIAIVGLVVVLNTVLYTQNVTNRTALDATDDAAELETAVVDEVPALVGRTNRNATYGSPAEVRAAVNDNLTQLGALVGTSVTNRRPASVGVEVVKKPSVALVVEHNESSRAFTDRNGGSDWTVAELATVQQYRMNVDADSLEATDEDAFRVVVASGDDEWTMRVHDNGSGVDLDRVEVDGTESTCTVEHSGGTVGIDFVDETAGDDCTFDFAEDVDAPYELGYANATNATGEYRLVLGGTGPSLGAVNTSSPDSDPISPYRSYAVDAVTVNVTYATPELRYRTTTNVTIPDP